MDSVATYRARIYDAARIGFVTALVLALDSCGGSSSTTMPSGGERVAAIPEMHNTGTLTAFNVPGATKVFTSPCLPPNSSQGLCGTTVTSMNNGGIITGYYTKSLSFAVRGFIRSEGGAISTFDAPYAGHGTGQGTSPNAINDRNFIVGYAQTSTNAYRGFLRSPEGQYRIIDAPYAGSGPFQGTVPFGINRNGVITGTYVDRNNVFHGFVRFLNGGTTSFDPEGSVHTQPGPEGAINAEGEIVGIYIDKSGNIHGFLRSPNGAITCIEPPGAHGLTVPGSINDDGVTSGYYVDAKGIFHAFLRTRNNKYTTYDAPNASLVPGQGTVVGAINAIATTAGSGFDAKGVGHGFVRTIDNTYATFDAPGAGGTVLNAGTIPDAIDSSGVVSGFYVDVHNINHGFVWQPPAQTFFTFAQPNVEQNNGTSGSKPNLRFLPSLLNGYIPNR